MNQNLTILHAQLGQEIFDTQEKLNRIEFAYSQTVCELAVTRAKRDELLTALNGLLVYFESGNSVPVSQATIQSNSAEVLAARAALAKAGGEV